jgi:hypothetical protein
MDHIWFIVNRQSLPFPNITQCPPPPPPPSRKIENSKTAPGDKPEAEVKITASGELQAE